MNREEQLKFCKVCENQKFDLKQGIICGLTDQIADFEETCYDFVENSFLREEWEASKKEADVESRMASGGKRFANYIVDTIFFYILSLAAGVLWGLLFPEMFTNMDEDSLTLIGYGIAFMVFLLYHTVLEFAFGKTIGKMITNTRVVDLDGNKPTLGACLGRSLARFIPFEPFSFLGSDYSGWHDKLTKTRVIDNY